MWKKYLNNPLGLTVGDCVIRAISVVMGKTWDDVYINLCIQGFLMGDMPSSNAVWSAYLKENGFKRKTIEENKDLYSVENFCKDHSIGAYVIGTGSHAVAVVDGNIFDAWDSSQETPVYYFEKEK